MRPFLLGWQVMVLGSGWVSLGARVSLHSRLLPIAQDSAFACPITLPARHCWQQAMCLASRSRRKAWGCHVDGKDRPCLGRGKVNSGKMWEFCHRRLRNLQDPGSSACEGSCQLVHRILRNPGRSNYKIILKGWLCPAASYQLNITWLQTCSSSSSFTTSRML